LKEGDVVRVKPQERDKKWIKAKVEQQVDIRSYEETTEDGRVFWQNRRHLQKTPEEYTTVTSEVSAEPDIPTQPVYQLKQSKLSVVKNLPWCS